MMLSLMLAKVIGLTLMIVAASMLVNRKNVDLLFSAYSHPESVFVTGVVEVVLGLSLVLNHNIWTLDFRGIITVVAWMLLVRGVERCFFATRVPSILEKFRKMQSVFAPLLVLILLIGAYLAYSGFMR